MTDTLLDLFRQWSASDVGLKALIDRERRILAVGGSLFLPEFRDGEPEGRRLEELFGCTDGSGDSFLPDCGNREQCAWCGIFRVIREAMESREKRVGETSLTVRRDGDFRYHDFQVVAEPVTADGEELFLFSLTDITDRRRRVLMEKLFYHDILNTVSSLTMNISLLQELAPTEEVRKYTESLERITDQLTEELQRQRLISLAESGRLEIEKAIINVPEFVGEIIFSFEGSREKKGRTIALSVADPAGGGMVIVSDKTLLRRIVVNLIKNALEAVPDTGEVTVGVSRAGDLIKMDVMNPGVIPEEVRSRIFHQFYSTKGQNRGMGTYSVRLLTENYLKGTVSFSSTEEKGTVFTVLLPDFRNLSK